MKTEVLLRDVEPGDLPIFFEHQRDPIAVALVVFRSRDKAEFDEHWAKILADDTCLKKTIVADGQVAGDIAASMRVPQKCGFTLCKSANDQEPELVGESHSRLQRLTMRRSLNDRSRSAYLGP